jgi:methionyl-tRNA formyltransferase
MPVRQNNSIATYAKKIKKNETQIDFDSNAADAHNKIRAFSPKPGAWFILDSKKYKIFDSKLISQQEIGKIEIKKNLILKFKKDYLIVKKIQKEGRNILVIEDFARGQDKELKNIRKKLGPSDKI